MNTRSRKCLATIAIGAALMTGGLVSAVPASAESVNKTESLPYAYDDAGKVVYGKMYYAVNESSPGDRYIYKLTVSTTSKVKQTVYWNVYCGGVKKWGGYDTFTESSSLTVNQAVKCHSPNVLNVTYSTTAGAKSELVLFP
ncbi:MAG: hypothetical protein QG622_922 [Actinomycetota bacterium]|nr:hypothetical protein [Actinomycetota bacterium]